MKQESNHTLNPTDIFFLNTRFLLIVMVVLGNILMPLLSTHAEAQAIVMTIFTFHMPIFVLITGYFSKGFPEDPQLQQVLLRILLQYLIFQTLYSALDYFFFRTAHTVYSFWAPYWMLWFLFSHLGWKLLLIVFRKLKHPLLTAWMLGILVGYLPFDGFWASISRTFVFFPFFLMGYYYQGNFLTKAARSLRLKLAAVLLLALVAAGFYTGTFHLSIDWLLGSRTYHEMNLSHWYVGLGRIAVYAFALVASAAFLMLQSTKYGRITTWGERTVYVFLLHGAVIKVLTAAGIYEAPWPPLATVLLMVILGVTITLLLSGSRVAALTHPLIHPNPQPFLGKIRSFHRT
ncbi:acyltransferase family protein [Paenibacillus silviterrae]|uniref:acyltransferase family protein n=1 Tax=Paenibacillus silviterrae TaxID=3242194 RepID=UPI0025429E07|nr:acyltransferase family protein [Paenibacillus chinjuensis]